MTMITFQDGSNAFNFRVAAVILSRGRVLLQSATDMDFWVLPGGRAELGELALESVRREMREELGDELTVERLLWVVEGFFTLGERRWHEIGLYFLLRPAEDSPLHGREGVFDSDEVAPGGGPGNLIFQWRQIGELEQVRLYPAFLRTALRELPQTIQHLVVIE